MNPRLSSLTGGSPGRLLAASLVRVVGNGKFIDRTGEVQLVTGLRVE